MVDKAMAARLVRARELDGHFKDATDAARRLGVAPSTYLGHENGSRGFRHSVPKYARFYKVRLEWLLEGIGEPHAKAAEAKFIDLTPAEQALLDDFANLLRSRRIRE